MLTSAVCRNESLDVLGHLSSDGCMRPWLPSYASVPTPPSGPPEPLLHELHLQRLLPQPKWRVLLVRPQSRSMVLAPVLQCTLRAAPHVCSAISVWLQQGCTKAAIRHESRVTVYKNEEVLCSTCMI